MPLKMPVHKIRQASATSPTGIEQVGIRICHNWIRIPSKMPMHKIRNASTTATVRLVPGAIIAARTHPVACRSSRTDAPSYRLLPPDHAKDATGPAV